MGNKGRRYGHYQPPDGHSRYREHPADRGKLFKIIKMLYGLVGLHFSEKAEPMDAGAAVLEYFIFPFTADFGEIIEDYLNDRILPITEEILLYFLRQFGLIGRQRELLAACGGEYYGNKLFIEKLDGLP